MIVDRPRNNTKSFRPVYPRVVEVGYTSAPYALVSVGDESSSCPGYPLDRRYYESVYKLKVQMTFNVALLGLESDDLLEVYASASNKVMSLSNSYGVDEIARWSITDSAFLLVYNNVTINVSDEDVDFFDNTHGGSLVRVRLYDSGGFLISEYKNEDLNAGIRSSISFGITNNTSRIEVDIVNYKTDSEDFESFQDGDISSTTIGMYFDSFAKGEAAGFEDYSVGEITDTPDRVNISQFFISVIDDFESYTETESGEEVDMSLLIDQYLTGRGVNIITPRVETF